MAVQSVQRVLPHTAPLALKRESEQKQPDDIETPIYVTVKTGSWWGRSGPWLPLG